MEHLTGIQTRDLIISLLLLSYWTLVAAECTKMLEDLIQIPAMLPLSTLLSVNENLMWPPSKKR